MRLRPSFRLNARPEPLECSLTRERHIRFPATTVNVHRFEETINGREYVIEVLSVAHDQWRAQIARPPGGSAALMPFYGSTPDEAAQQLSRWLSLAHGQARARL